MGKFKYLPSVLCWTAYVALLVLATVSALFGELTLFKALVTFLIITAAGGNILNYLFKLPMNAGGRSINYQNGANFYSRLFIFITMSFLFFVALGINWAAV